MALKLATTEMDRPVEKTGPERSGGFYSRKHALDHEDIREIQAYATILFIKNQKKKIE